MSHRRRIYLLIFIMFAVVFFTGMTTIYTLYHIALEQQRERLIESAKGWARLMEAVARFDEKYSSEDVPGGAFQATLSQIRESHKQFEGFGETGEFTLGRREGNQIVFLLPHRKYSSQQLKSLPFSSKIAVPMKLALSGKSGTILATDHHGEKVLAAYEPVAHLDLGVVVKIDLTEIRAPFIKGSFLIAGGSLLLLLLGAFLFRRIGDPLIQKLEENEKKYRTLFEGANDAIFLLKDKFLDCNDQACRLLACERKDILGKSPLDISPETQPDGRNSENVILLQNQAAIAGKPQFFYWQCQRNDGIRLETEVLLKGIEIGGQKMLLATVRDITQRMKDEKALEQSEEKFRTLVEQAGDAFFLITSEGKFVDVNQRACNALGYTREELLKLSVPEIDPVFPKKRFFKFTQSLAPEEMVTIEGVHKRKDGTTFPVETRVGWINIGEEEFILALARDVSERKRIEEERLSLERQLRQSQRMEIIGTLAAGIAHDFNNILTPILGYTDLALSNLSPSDPNHARLEKVLEAGGRAKEMIKQLVYLSSPQALERDRKKGPEKLSSIVKEVLRLFRSSIPSNITVNEKFNGNEEFTSADPTQVHQVVMNLCTNALQAMRKKGGILELSIDSSKLDPPLEKEYPALADKELLRLCIHDSGPGINPEILEKIFDPFFSTKSGVGTGFGLSTVRRIVASLGGVITVESESGKGSLFCVYFPKVTGEIIEKASKEKRAPKGKEKILFIDDEEAILSLGKEMLEKLGYRVTAEISSLEALKFFRNDPNRFDLIIADQKMPDLVGTDLAKEIRLTRPEIPIILITGFSESVNPNNCEKFGIDKCLLKPFDSHKLGQMIREVLEKKETV